MTSTDYCAIAARAVIVDFQILKLRNPSGSIVRNVYCSAKGGASLVNR